MKSKYIQTILIILIFSLVSFIVVKYQKVDCTKQTKQFLDWFINTRIQEKPKPIQINLENNFEISSSEVKGYLSFLEKSNFFSKEFLTNLENYYKKGKDYYYQHKQYADTPPMGFNLNLLFFSQSLPQYIYYGKGLEQEEKPKDYNLKIEKINNDGQHILVDDNFHFEFDEECKILNIDSFKTGGIRAGVMNSFNKQQ